MPAGVVLAWGWNGFGQLGDGTTTDRLTPVAVGGVTDVVALAAGGYHSLALRGDGTVWAWGASWYGQLGDGTTTHRWIPVAVSGLTDVVAIAAGWVHSLALRRDGTVWAWGNNDNGELGDGTTTDRYTPVPVSGLTDVVAIAAGGRHSLALRRDGTVWAWGWNISGQLGDGTTTNRLTPVSVSGLTEVAALKASLGHNLVLRRDGTVWSWGNNCCGQLGDGTTTNRWTPVAVADLINVVALAAGDAHSLALRSDGTIWAWGNNDDFQLGYGTTFDQLTPIAIFWQTDVVALAAGGRHSLALRADGTVWTWGGNDSGQLGDGTTTNRWTPVAVSGLTNALTLTAGLAHSLAVLVPPALDPIPHALTIGGTNTLTGSGFTAKAVIMLFVSKAEGATAHGPYTPQNRTATSLTWDIPADILLGSGFGSVQVVNTDQSYLASNVVGALLEGDPAANIPTILYLNGEPLAPVAPGINVAHSDTVIAKGSVVTIVGTGFNNPGVALYTAAGNVGPLWPVGGWTQTQFQVNVPTDTSTGPGTFQVVNQEGGKVSNAVSAVIGARPTVTVVSVLGSTVTVTGTGFCSLSAINLFNLQGALVVNLGGLGPSGATIPLTIVSDTQFTFTLPPTAVSGPAFVQVLNPPYIPFSSSGADPSGAFTIP